MVKSQQRGWVLKKDIVNVTVQMSATIHAQLEAIALAEGLSMSARLRQMIVNEYRALQRRDRELGHGK
jgi:hypothetical protein